LKVQLLSELDPLKRLQTIDSLMGQDGDAYQSNGADT
jgi:hypothetical protein